MLLLRCQLAPADDLVTAARQLQGLETLCCQHDVIVQLGLVVEPDPATDDGT